MHASEDLSNDSIGMPVERASTAQRLLQFSAARLFYFVTLCASATALFGWLGLPIGCFVMLIWVQLFVGIQREAESAAEQPRQSPARSGLAKIEMVAVLLSVLLLVGLFTPNVSDSDPLQHAETSMKLVAKAVEAYCQHHGAYPPAIVRDANGLPMHSWRALILPYLNEPTLAANYRWDEAWNGPNNVQLLQYRPWHYRLYYPNGDTLRTLTSLHLLRDESQRVFVVEHEQAQSGWLEPTAIDSWQGFTQPAAVNQGFWHHSFFVSNYRGRLAVTATQSLRMHPSPRHTSPRRSSARHSSPRHSSSRDSSPTVNSPIVSGQVQQSIEVGVPHRKIHFDNAWRLGIFLMVALYPFRYLHSLRRNIRRS